MKIAYRPTTIVMVMLLFPGFAAQAQDWSPLTPTEKFNFTVSGMNVITNTIWIDSVKMVGSDSVFYLNRIVTGCDTCPAGYKLANQPDFLRSRMIKKPGGVYNFRDPGTVVIRTWAKPGDTWLYDTVNNIQVQSVSCFVDQVFGVADSVKEFSLSNGYSVRLSKHSGLIRFPSYDITGYLYLLEGIEGRNVGQRVPAFREIYKFNPGDIFQYTGKTMSYSVPYGGGSGYLEKIQVLSGDSVAGHYSYNILRYLCTWSLSVQGIPWDTVHSYSYDTLVFQDSLTHPANYYPNQVIENPIDPGIFGPNTCYFRTMEDGNGIYTKWIGAYNLCGEAPTYIHGTLATPPRPWIVLVPGPFLAYLHVFQAGLGNSTSILMAFESEERRELVGYIKNGDTTGIIYPDDLLLQGIDKLSRTAGLTVSPNPAFTKIRVAGTGLAPASTVEIYSLQGMLVRRMAYAETIDISGLQPGSYFIRISEPGHGTYRGGRFIKQ